MRASQKFWAAEAEQVATCWATDDVEDGAEDRAAALARHTAAEATQAAAGRLLIDQPATTLLGMRAKARAAIVWYGDTSPQGWLGGDIL